MRKLLLVLTFILVINISKPLKLKEIRLPSSQHVKYMPAGYKKKQTKLTACPAPSTSSAGGGRKFLGLRNADSHEEVSDDDFPAQASISGLSWQAEWWQPQSLVISSTTSTQTTTTTTIIITKEKFNIFCPKRSNDGFVFCLWLNVELFPQTARTTTTRSSTTTTTATWTWTWWAWPWGEVGGLMISTLSSVTSSLSTSLARAWSVWTESSVKLPPVTSQTWTLSLSGWRGDIADNIWSLRQHFCISASRPAWLPATTRIRLILTECLMLFIQTKLTVTPSTLVFPHSRSGFPHFTFFTLKYNTDCELNTVSLWASQPDSLYRVRRVRREQDQQIPGPSYLK